MLTTKIKHTITHLSLATLMLVNLSGASIVMAAPTAPTPPPKPSAPPAPTPPPAPSQEQLVTDHQAKVTAATATPTPTPAPTPTPTPTPSSSPQPTPTPSPSSSTVTSTSNNPNNTQTLANDAANLSVTPGTTGSGVGDSAIETGNTTVTAAITSGVNNNLGSGSGTGDPLSSQENSGNGAMSTNTTDLTSATNDLTSQNNSAIIGNDLDAGAVSGTNHNNYNVGSTTTSSGNANTMATVVTAANTNMAGVDAAEFNIVDDHVGDIILDFNDPCSTGGCQAGDVNFLNSGNGALSDNSNSSTTLTDDQTFQGNDANVVNNIVLGANSGDNTSNYNTGGNSSIETGDANIVANIANFLNNNIAGGVKLATVNIMGNLVGDIIAPASALSGSANSTNSGNGAYSTNTNSTSNTTNTGLYQDNFANIDNSVDIATTTGDNQTNYNTHTPGGDQGNSVLTGNSSADVKVANIANQNIAGGDWWIVLVNEAGNWVGKIVGAPDGASMAGSTGTQFIENPDGSIDIVNTGNGVLTDNTNTNSQTTNTTTSQTNKANLVNNISLDANTGGNETNYNTGGNNTISTGNANVMLDLVNFVNNNFAGGNVMVTVVNVFGSWIGDFVPPENTNQLPDPGIGGLPGGVTDQGSNSGDNSGTTTDPTNPNSNPDSTTTPSSTQETTPNTQNLDPNSTSDTTDATATLLGDTTLPQATPLTTVSRATKQVVSHPRVLGTATWYLTEKLEDGIASSLTADAQKAHRPKSLTITFAWPTVTSFILGLAYTATKAKGLLFG